MREVRFEVDGETVAGSLHEPAGTPRGHLVLVHGFLSQRGEFGDAAERLAQRGWRVLAIDSRGFGASGGPRGRIGAARAIGDVKAALEWLARDRPGLPAGIVAHSMGTCFALGALAQGADAKAVVLAAPMSNVRAEVGQAEFLGYKAARAASNLAERIGLGPIAVPYKYREKDLFVDAEAARRAEAAGFLGRKISLANFNDLLSDAMDSRTYAPRVRQPALVILAKHDRAVKRASSLSVHDALGGPKELVEVDSGHSMFGDRDAASVLGHIDRWMGRHLLA